MQTLRGRLTAWYSGALALTLAAFAGVLYLDRRSASYQDLDQRIQSEAALTAGILAESYRARGTLVRADTAHHSVLIPDLAALLETVPDFLVITARDGSLLFASSDARALTFQQVEQLRRLASAPLSGRSSGTLRLEPNGPKIHYVVHYVTDAGPQFGAILAGADVRTAELGRPAALHGRREPRAEDAAHRAARRRGARDHDPQPAPGDTRDAGRDAAGDQAHDGASGRAAHAGPGRRRHCSAAP